MPYPLTDTKQGAATGGKQVIRFVPILPGSRHSSVNVKTRVGGNKEKGKKSSARNPLVLPVKLRSRTSNMSVCGHLRGLFPYRASLPVSIVFRGPNLQLRFYILIAARG